MREKSKLNPTPRGCARSDGPIAVHNFFVPVQTISTGYPRAVFSTGPFIVQSFISNSYDTAAAAQVGSVQGAISHMVQHCLSRYCLDGLLVANLISLLEATVLCIWTLRASSIMPS